ncbi:hypothetical protein cypCar_00048528 [Cyprinus carpio]|nr:hypothetical protein cypCar_00048528 [Cyprinus carpio]
MEDQSEDDSVSLSPSLPSPPLQAAHRTTNFFIDNILRPDFGCKREQRPGARSFVARPTVPSTPCPDSNCSTDSVSSSASSTVSSPASSRHFKVDEAERGNAAHCGVVSASSVAVNSPSETSSPSKDKQPVLWPAWVYCTRYSDRPSSALSDHVALTTKLNTPVSLVSKMALTFDEMVYIHGFVSLLSLHKAQGPGN